MPLSNSTLSGLVSLMSCPSISMFWASRIRSPFPCRGPANRRTALTYWRLHLCRRPGGQALLRLHELVPQVADLLSGQRLAKTWPHLRLLERHMVAGSRDELPQQLFEPVIPWLQRPQLPERLPGFLLLTQGFTRKLGTSWHLVFDDRPEAPLLDRLVTRFIGYQLLRQPLPADQLDLVSAASSVRAVLERGERALHLLVITPQDTECVHHDSPSHEYRSPVLPGTSCLKPGETCGKNPPARFARASRG